MRRLLAVPVALAAAGCSATGTVPVQPVSITSSDFCEIQREKLTWDVKDTPETIKGIRRFNVKWDSRCGKARPTS